MLQRSAVAARILFVAFIGVSDSLLWPCRLRPISAARVRVAHKNLSSEGLDMFLPFELAVSAQPFDSQAVQREINDRRGVEREHLAQNQAADNGDAERIAEFRTRALCREPTAKRQTGRPWWSSEWAESAGGKPEKWHPEGFCPRCVRRPAQSRSSEWRFS